MPNGTKICPFCAEEIKSAAIKCKHCGSDLNTAPPSLQSSPPPPQVRSEIEFFKDVSILVTNTRVVITRENMPEKTYSLANITSVSSSIVSNAGQGVFLLIGGLALAFVFFASSASSPDGTCGISIGVASAGAAVVGLIMMMTKPQVTLKIKSASTEESALTSTDVKYIENIITAINKAIAARG